MPQRKLECGNVAISNKDLRISLDNLIVDSIQQSSRPIPSSGAENRVDPWIGEHGLEI
jgi:hypothetical protein